MGKGNRSRLNRASDILADAPNTAVAKRNNSKTIAIIVSIAVALILVGCLVLSYVVSSGVLVRAKTAVKSDNYKVSGSVLTYFFYAQYQNFLSYYGSYASYFGLDTSKSLKSQSFSETQTWYEYFMDATATQVTQIVTLCEGAKAAGISLDDADKAEIEESIDTLKGYASESNVTVATYIAQRFGSGVTLSDIRKATEMSKLASKYQEKLLDEFKAGLTDDELQKHIDENKANFLTADVLKYVFKAEMKTEGAEATAEEKTAYESNKAAMSAKADALKAAASTEEAFKAWMIDYLCGDTASDAFDAAYEEQAKALDDASKPSAEVLADAKTKTIAYLRASMEGAEGATAPTWPDTAYDTVLGKVVTSVYGTVVTNGFTPITSSGIAWSDPAAEDASELNKWLFADGRKEGDTFIDKSEGDTSSTYTVYFVKEAAHKNTSRTVSAAHILVTAATTAYDESDTDKTNPASEAAKKKADEILAEYLAGDHTLDAFKALGEKYTEDSNVLYENIKEGDMVAEFNDWIFDEARADGDTGIVKTDYGYHVMYFAGEGDPVWKVNARDAVLDKKLSDWYEEFGAKYHVECDKEKLTYVNA